MNKQEKSKAVSRRSFLQSSLAAGIGASAVSESPARGRRRGSVGPNDRIRLGFIGVGNRGTQLLQEFIKQPDAEIVGLCDVYEPYLYRDSSSIRQSLKDALGGRIPVMNEGLSDRVSRHKDFRRLLERSDIDAVVIATPDHWHAIQLILACESGKDVYVEKPLSATVVEGRRMVEAAKRTGRVVQVGLQRRSSHVYRELPALVQGGELGRITVARAYHVSNMFPHGIGRYPESEAPPEFDWDFWLGPRAWRAYRENIHPYRFRWWADFSSQVGNWGVHYFDTICWMLGETAPTSVSAHGGKFVVQDDRTIPDTMEVIFEFRSGRLLIFGQYEGTGEDAIERGEIELRGTRGNLYTNPDYSDRAGYEIVASRGGQFQDPRPRLEERKVRKETRDSTGAHIRNFLDCVRSRKQCNCDLETGHRSTTFAHLANIALGVGARIEWDAEGERVTNAAPANELLHYDYRAPWKLG